MISLAALIRSVAVLGLLVVCAPGWASVWGYVDAQGRRFFADHQVNPRYQLLYKGDTSASFAAVPGGGARSAAWARPSVGAAFDISVRYKAVRHLVREAATATGLEFELLKAVIATESGFNAQAVSPVGAVGLMQVMPDTAQRFGVKPLKNQSVEQRLTDPRTNISAGSRYLAWLLKRFGGNVELALAAYNAGEGAVDRAGRRIPDFKETQHYVRKVMRLHQDLRVPQAVKQQRAQAPARTSAPAPSLTAAR